MRECIIFRGMGREGEYECADPVACSLFTARELVVLAEGTATAFGLRLVGMRWTAGEESMEQTRGFFELARSDLLFGHVDRILVRRHISSDASVVAKSSSPQPTPPRSASGAWAGGGGEGRRSW